MLNGNRSGVYSDNLNSYEFKHLKEGLCSKISLVFCNLYM